MDAIRNPYSPGAGSPPPELAGRDALREQVRIAVARIRIGRQAKSVVLVGLRGVGKTVLLDRMRADAEENGVFTIRAETPENRSLPALLAPQLRSMLLRLDRVEAAREFAQRGLRALAGFVGAFRLKYHDIEVVLDAAPESGLADNGELEGDLAVLFEQVGIAARSAGTAAVMFVDELQYLAEDQFASLISALHRCAQQQLPVMLVGAGLPQLRGMAGNAKSYAERLFDFPMIDRLPAPEATRALVRPAEAEQVFYTGSAVEEILAKTLGYPYFLQEWGKHVWEVAEQSPINLGDVHQSTRLAIAALDASFFRVRLDRLTPKEKQYMRAMAELGAGPHRSGDIATAANRSVNTLAPLRQGLIAKGMIWSPSHGDTAFTVPLFDEFMKRIMPGEDWRTE